MQFTEIIKYAKEYKIRFGEKTIKYIEKNIYQAESVCLCFTLHGDRGSTVGKSNYWVLNSLIESQEYKLGDLTGVKNIINDSSTWIAITGDVPDPVWHAIVSAIVRVERYPLLDEDHYSKQQFEDCWNTWTSWQYSQIVRELEENYSINNIALIEEQKNNDDSYTWLFNIINNCDLIPSSNEVDIIEANSCSYYNYDNKKLMAELARYIKENFNF